MAMVAMHKIYLGAMKHQKTEMLEFLQRLGAVQLTEGEKEERYLFAAEQDKKERLRKEKQLHSIQEAIRLLLPYDTEKKPLFFSGEAITEEGWEQLADEAESGVQLAEEALRLATKQKSLTEQETALQHKLAALSAYRAYPLPFEMHKTEFTELFLGSLPVRTETAEINEALSALPAVLSLLGQDEENHYISVVCSRAARKETRSLLLNHEFRELDCRGLQGTAAENSEKIKNKQLLLQQENKNLTESLKKMASELPRLKKLRDYLHSLLTLAAIRTESEETEMVFFLKGWVPADRSERVCRKLCDRFPGLYAETKEPEPGEEVPILLRNNRFVRPFELITELYSLPDSHEADPNPVMSVFFVAFFGMMLSDAGYGMILALLTGFLLARYQPQGMAGKLLKILFFGGLSTIFWGVLFGGWFGDLLTGLPAFRPRWFSPLEEPMTLLIWSFVFGGVHIVAGMAIEAWQLIQNGKWPDAVFDIGSWYLLFAGLLFWLFGKGAFLALAGALSLILTQGRHEKNPLKALGSGLLSLYDITSYISDVLSYSRLLALGLATGVIGQVVNTMGRLSGSSPLGILMFTVILLVGHTFNLAINTLGAYVHASRLQYVEFYGKFFTGGGRPFKPLCRETDYITVK